MLDTKKINELDIVVLEEDLPEYELKKGEQAVVIEVFENPEAYDLEFINESAGESKLAYGIKPEMLNVIDNKPAA